MKNCAAESSTGGSETATSSNPPALPSASVVIETRSRPELLESGLGGVVRYATKRRRLRELGLRRAAHFRLEEVALRTLAPIPSRSPGTRRRAPVRSGATLCQALRGELSLPVTGGPGMVEASIL
jgi:hypothetical protein